MSSPRLDVAQADASASHSLIAARTSSWPIPRSLLSSPLTGAFPLPSPYCQALMKSGKALKSPLASFSSPDFCRSFDETCLRSHFWPVSSSMIFTISFCEGLNELISRYLLAVSSRWLKTAAMARPTKYRLVVCEGSSPESTMVVVLVLSSYPEKPRLRDCELPYQYLYRGRRPALYVVC